MNKNIKRILSFFLALMLMSVTFSVNAVSTDFDTENAYKYDQFIIPQVLEHPTFQGNETEIYYDELYEHSSSTADESTPDFVVIKISSNYITDWDAAVFGDYIIRKDSGDVPFSLGYAVYIPEKNELYSLPQADKLGLDGFDILFTELGIGELIGDMDKDRKITIKDATCIQKCLANIVKFENDEIWAYIYNFEAPLKYISDFNRDCNRNIEDATAIQKHLAKMDF